MRNPIPVIAAMLFACTASAQTGAGFEILLKNGTIFPERNITDQNIARFNNSPGRQFARQLVIIQFDHVPSETEKAALSGQGIHLLDYIPHNAYTATIDGELDVQVLQRFQARSIVELTAQHKMEERLSRGDFPSWSVRSAGTVDTWVSFPKTYSATEVLAELKKRNYEILSETQLAYRIIEIRSPVSRLGELALYPFIDYLEPVPPPVTTLNAMGQWLSRANILKAPLSVGGNALTGNGVVIGIGDDGDVQTHLDIKNRLINRTGSSPANHATHVTGTAGGAGLINEFYEGYAPQSTIISQMFSGIITNAPTYVADHGMVITNNSYGFVINDCPFNGLYDLPARTIDQLAIDYPELTHVVAAGNDGHRTCAPYAQGFHTVLGGYQTAKNVITVGSTDFRGTIGSTSSRGPSKDGRTKPEITSQGVFLPSTWTYNFYSYNNGTSMAAPGVSGGLALLVEQYRLANAGANPRSGLLKALVSNSGYDRGLSGPDFKYGFGSVNFKRASMMMEDGNFVNTSVTQGATQTHTINVPANTALLKVLVFWPDPPASLLAAKTLVNDLDLEVQSINGTVLPLRPDTAAASLDVPAITGADHINNIEQVVISNPVAGSYDLKITGTTIAQNPSQEYFLVYDMIPAGLSLTNPVGGERMIESIVFGLDSVYIQWESYGPAEAGFMVEFFDGSAWTTLNGGNPVDGSFRAFNWGVPSNLSTNAARIRVTGTTSLLQDVSEPFVITPTLNVNLSTVQCEGYIQIDWNSLVNVTSYEVMMLQGENWITVTTTNQLFYIFSGLSPDSLYWVTVQPLVNGTPGKRAIAVSRQPTDGTCANDISDNDLRVSDIIAPVRSGRLNTSTALSNNETVTIRIRNLDNVTVSGSMDVSYSVNGTPVQTTTINPVIAAGADYDHSFSTPADLSSAGDYLIEASIIFTADPVTANNSLSKNFRQLANDPITIADLPWTDDLESMPVQETRFDRMGLTGRDRFDFVNSSDTGRLRTFINSGIAYSGTKAITLDSWIANGGTVDSLTATFNLASFTLTDDIRIDFRYKNHGQSANPANKVWIRGTDTEPWISIFDLYENQPDNDGSYKLIQSVELNDSLSAYGQAFSSSFQMRIGQWGKHITADNESGAGYSFDDFRIYRAIDDIQVLAIDTPVVIACGLNATVPVKAIVRNTSASTINNIPIVLRVDGVIAATESIPSIPGNDTIHYTFTATANLLASGDHLVEVWVELPSDNVPDNDTASVTAKNVRLENSFPYLENFESGDGTWYTESTTKGSWSFGTPASAKINRAASGSNAWKTNLYGYYDNNELGYLYSPCFDVSSMSAPTLSFSLSLDIEDCGAGVYCDGAWVDYSTDGGQSWQRLGATGQGTNWYNRNYSGNEVWSQQNYQRWHVATIPLPLAANLRLRFGFQSDVGLTKDGIAVDDIHIYDNIYGIYTGTGESPASVQPALSGTGWVDFLVDNKLIASVNPDGQTLGDTEAKSYVNTGGVRINKQQYYHDRNITIKPAIVNLPDSATVRFYFLDSETEALINATGCTGCYKPAMAYDLGVTKYSDNDDSKENGTLSDNLLGNYLFIHSTKVDKIPFDKGYYAEFRVKDFSEFWLNNGGFDNNTPLPAELLSFTADKNGADVLLRWVTASETDVLKYEIEVAKGNDAYGQGQFIRIGEVASQGNSTTEQYYQFTDLELMKTGTRYYRLRIPDIDGHVSYSPVRPVIFRNDLVWQVYPVPTDGRFTLYCQGNPAELVHARIINTEGKTIQEFEFRATGFPQKIETDLKAPAGVYILEVMSERGRQQFRLVRQ